MLPYDRDFPLITKLYILPTSVVIEFLTVLIGLIVTLVPTWTWGMRYVKKQIEKRNNIVKEREDIVAKIVNIDKVVSHIDEKLKQFIAKDASELKLSDKATFICEENGVCIEANPALCDLFGATRSEMLGYGWTDFIIKEDREGAIAHWESAIARNVSITDDYRINKGLSGEIVHVKYRAVVTRLEDGSILNVLGQVYIYDKK